MKKLLYRLLFTKEDSVDTSQVVLIALYALFGVIMVNTARGAWTMNSELVSTMRFVLGVAVLNASPTWLALAWLKRKKAD